MMDWSLGRCGQLGVARWALTRAGMQPASVLAAILAFACAESGDVARQTHAEGGAAGSDAAAGASGSGAAPTEGGGTSGSGGSFVDGAADAAAPGSIRRSQSITGGASRLWDMATDGKGVLLAAQLQGAFDLGGQKISAEWDDITLLAYDASGDYSWHRSFDAVAVEYVSVETDPAGDIYLAGVVRTIALGTAQHGSAASNDRVLFIAKLSQDGTPLWSRATVSGSGAVGEWAIPIQLAVDARGDILIAGTLNPTGIDFGGGHALGPGDGETDSYLVKLDARGDALWIHRLAESSNNQLAVVPAGTALVLGHTRDASDIGGAVPECPNASSGPCLAAVGFSPAGDRTWVRQWWADSSEHAWPTSASARDGAFLVAGKGQGMDFGNGPEGRTSDHFVAKVGDDGAYQWGRFTRGAIEQSATVAPTGTTYVAGTCSLSVEVGGTSLTGSSETYNLYSAAYDASGQQRFANVLGHGDQIEPVVWVVGTPAGPVIGGHFRGEIVVDPAIAGTGDQGSIFLLWLDDPAP